MDFFLTNRLLDDETRIFYIHIYSFQDAICNTV